MRREVGRCQPTPRLRYLDDLTTGQRFTSAARQVDSARIKNFARQDDPQPFHLDEEGARDSLFGGLAVTGWHVAAITMSLLVEGGAQFAGGIVGAGGEFAWPRPTRPADSLQVTSEVVEIVPSKSRPDRGGVTLRGDDRNQSGDVVQALTAKLVAPRRPQSR